MKRLLPLLVLASPAAAQATFTVIQSGSFPTANADASAIVGTDAQGAFLWTVAGGYTPLGEQSGVGVSEDGQTVLGQITDPVTGENVAGLWTAATGWQSLGGFGSSCGSDASNPYELSGDAQTAVGLGWFGCQGRAFRYTNTFGMQQLPMQTNNNSRASAISVDGNWIGGWEEDATGARRACVWDSSLNQSFILVSATNANGAGEVYGFSHDGAYAVGTEGSGAYIWEQASGTATSLGAVPGGGFLDKTILLCVDEDGERAGGTFGFGPFGRAILWSPSNGYEYLDDVLTAGGVDMSAWETANVSHISPDGNILVGAVRAAGGFASSIFIATLGAGDLGTNFCTAVPNSTGSAGSIAGIGSDLVAANNLTLEASSLPPGQFAYFVNGPSPGFIAGPGGSQGNLCLLGGLGRHRLQVGTADAAGVYSIQVDLTSFPRPTGFVAVQPGETWHFSCWYRDQNPTPTSNFTDGLTITFQ